MVGAAGFEPTGGGTKNRCLTTWLRPKIIVKIFMIGKKNECGLYFCKKIKSISITFESLWLSINSINIHLFFWLLNSNKLAKILFKISKVSLFKIILFISNSILKICKKFGLNLSVWFKIKWSYKIFIFLNVVANSVVANLASKYFLKSNK